MNTEKIYLNYAIITLNIKAIKKDEGMGLMLHYSCWLNIKGYSSTLIVCNKTDDSMNYDFSNSNDDDNNNNRAVVTYINLNNSY